SDDARLVGAIVEELEAIKEEFADPRRTEIVDDGGQILDEELISIEDMIVTRTHLGYVKTTPVSEYSAQGRGGRGIRGAKSATDEDFVADMFVASTHDNLFLFTNTGRVYKKKVYELPRGARTARGKAFVNVIDLRDGEQVVGMLAVKELSPDQFVFMATRSGTVKKTTAEAFANVRSNGIKAIAVDEGDCLVGVRLTDGTMDILLATQNGLAIRFSENDVRAMGRDARGVRGINLKSGDAVVGMTAVDPEANLSLLTVCERGYGKRTLLSEYPCRGRGGRGVITIRVNHRNGPVVGVRLAEDEDHLILISDMGRLIRMRMDQISVMGRSTQGVRVMRLDKGERVVSVERLADPEEDAGDESPPEEATADPAAGDEASGDDAADADEGPGSSPTEDSSATTLNADADDDDDDEGEPA
ncbi:MAG TPA: DNA gyrase C-terminal beta-propeller domain-containing protein, partial [Kofleriaceae bacterium]|nr:DNA gyrase C-terminal beta-propeller domain-containing protein [Kofleriaceae bacterium]